METITITSKTAEAIMIPVNGSKIKRNMFNYVASQSLFDPYKKNNSDVYVTYTFRENGSIKDLFISDENGIIHPKSNKLTFTNGFFKIAAC